MDFLGAALRISLCLTTLMIDKSVQGQSNHTISEGDTPPLLVRSIQGGLRRYAVRKGSVRSTQKFCYIVRRHQFLLLKGPIFIKKTQHT